VARKRSRTRVVRFARRGAEPTKGTAYLTAGADKERTRARTKFTAGDGQAAEKVPPQLGREGGNPAGRVGGDCDGQEGVTYVCGGGGCVYFYFILGGFGSVWH